MKVWYWAALAVCGVAVSRGQMTPGPAPAAPASVVTVVDAPEIAGRAVQLDAQGKLLPWPMAESTGYSYSDYFLTQWTVIWDQYKRQRLPYFYCCFDFDRTTYEMVPDQHWANSTGYLRAMEEGFIERLYPYTGDARTIEFLTNFFDYEMDHGLTPVGQGYAYEGVPYPSANPGSPRYTGWSNHGEDFVEPHVIGEDGYAYLRLYEMTGDTRYLAEAIRCAEALVKNFKAGDAANSPWPYRCFARDGSVKGGKAMFPYSANVVEPVMLFDELIRLRLGDTAAYQRVRTGAWDWLMKYPMKNNIWVGYFEDVTASMDSMNNVIPLETARYILMHPEKDPQWKEHATDLIAWVKTTPKWPKWQVHGALVTTEQGSGLKDYCCNPPPQCCDSHSARLAAVEAIYFARTGVASYKNEAYRTYNFVTYFQGLSGAAHAPFSDQWWFTDEFADGPRRMMDGLWAVPEWAPEDESHLLGSSSVVTRISYGAGRVTYSTFDAESTDVLRLNFDVKTVLVNGRPIAARRDSDSEGYTFETRTRVLRVTHASGKNVDLEGEDGAAPVEMVTFDDPHGKAGTLLKGEYPSGVVNWGDGLWKLATPNGKFGTFNLVAVDASSSRIGFRFSAPRVFAGIDIYNGGTKDAALTVSSDAGRDLRLVIKSGELKRLRTGWGDAGKNVSFEMKDAEGLRFDNLAWRMP